MTESPTNTDPERPYDANRGEYLERITALFGDYKRHAIEFCGLAPGERVLDVGCGTGQDAAAMARIVGSSGRVTAIDRDQALIAKAQAATDAVDFRVGDIADLSFDDGQFDCTRADRVFQHLSDLSGALAEMVRVTVSGGRIVVIDVDWDTFVIDAADMDLTRRILRFASDCQACGWAGRRLYGLFKAAPLTNLEMLRESIAVTDLAVTRDMLGLAYFVAEAIRTGVLSAEEAEAWQADLEQRDTDGTFFAGISGYGVRGIRKT